MRGRGGGAQRGERSTTGSNSAQRFFRLQFRFAPLSTVVFAVVALRRMQRTRLSLRNACKINLGSACPNTKASSSTRSFHHGFTLRNATTESSGSDSLKSKPKITKKKYTELSSALLVEGVSLRPLAPWDGGLDAPPSSSRANEHHTSNTGRRIVENTEEELGISDSGSQSGRCTPSPVA